MFTFVGAVEAIVPKRTERPRRRSTRLRHPIEEREMRFLVSRLSERVSLLCFWAQQMHIWPLSFIPKTGAVSDPSAIVIMAPP
jgi:hypothetical protein